LAVQISVSDGKGTATLVPFDLTVKGTAVFSGKLTLNIAGYDLKIAGAEVILEDSNHNVYKNSTTSDGSFAFQELSSGNYIMKLLHPDLKPLNQEVTLGIGENLDLTDIPMDIYTADDIENAVKAERQKWDVDDDGKKGLPDAIRILQENSGM